MTENCSYYTLIDLISQPAPLLIILCVTVFAGLVGIGVGFILGRIERDYRLTLRKLQEKP